MKCQEFLENRLLMHTLHIKRESIDLFLGTSLNCCLNVKCVCAYFFAWLHAIPEEYCSNAQNTTPVKQMGVSYVPGSVNTMRHQVCLFVTAQ